MQLLAAIKDVAKKLEDMQPWLQNIEELTFNDQIVEAAKSIDKATCESCHSSSWSWKCTRLEVVIANGLKVLCLL